MAEVKGERGKVRMRERLSSDCGYTTTRHRPLRSMEDLS